MGALAQNICERYLKHIINEYVHPQNDIEEASKTSALRSPSLKKLILEIENADIYMSEEEKNSLLQVDGLYFSTRYPGDDSFELNKEYLKKCLEAVDVAKQFVEDYEQSLEENELQGFHL